MGMFQGLLDMVGLGKKNDTRPSGILSGDDLETIKKLAAEGAGRTAVEVASDLGYTEIVDILKAEMDKKQTPAQAAVEGVVLSPERIEFLEKEIESRPDINASPSTAEVVKILITKDVPTTTTAEVVDMLMNSPNPTIHAAGDKGVQPGVERDGIVK